jgi:hypothetical protein
MLQNTLVFQSLLCAYLLLNGHAKAHKQRLALLTNQGLSLGAKFLLIRPPFLRY